MTTFTDMLYTSMENENIPNADIVGVTSQDGTKNSGDGVGPNATVSYPGGKAIVVRLNAKPDQHHYDAKTKSMHI